MVLSDMFKEANEGLAKYNHIIGVGVLLLLIVTSGTLWYTYTEEKRIAEECGFIDEKIKCVCTKAAWDSYNGETGQLNLTKWEEILTEEEPIYLNISNDTE